jgi:hypothetical protein
LTGASVATRISGFVEGLSSSILHAVVGTFAVDSLVRDKIGAILRASESGASICIRDDLTNGNYSSVVTTPTRHVFAFDFTGL